MTQTTPGPSPSTAAAVSSGPAYRPDIDGLRAVAVMLVVIYHIWFGRVSGGVDAFLMISAFFLTGSLLRSWETRGSVRPLQRISRNFRRIVPLAAITVALTSIGSFFLLPASTRVGFIQQAWASLFYFENWKLAFSSIDYYADNATASPFQHFWSLSVQGQVFILWPILFFIAALVLRNLGQARRRTAALYMLSAIFVASLACSIVSTATRQEFAYYDTFSRLWEFAAGGLLAILLPRIHGPKWLFAALGWLGIIGLLSCGAVLDVQSGFPGYLALWPILSVAAIIISGSDPNVRFAPSRFLANPVLLKLGTWSYAIYLVHWPLLIFALNSKGGEHLTWLEGTCLILVSIALAWIMTTLVDQKLRNWSWPDRNWRRSLAVVLVFLVLGSTVIGSTQVSATIAANEQEAAAESGSPKNETHPGARVLDPTWTKEVPTDVPLIPLPHQLDEEWGTFPHSCAEMTPAVPDTLVNTCGMTEFQRGAFTLGVVGNSHPEQWLPALEAIADDQGWNLMAFLKGACKFAIRDPDSYDDPVFGADCRSWNDAVLDYLAEADPDAVLTIGTSTAPADATSPSDWGEKEAVVRGLDEAVERLQASKIPVVLLRDNPRFTFNAYECAIQDSTGSDCSVSRSQALAPYNPSLPLAGPGVSILDMSDILCPNGTCPAEIGNVAVYRDTNHLSLAYTETTVFALQPRLMRALSIAQ